jgi:hypothetical protein
MMMMRKMMKKMRMKKMRRRVMKAQHATSRLHSSDHPTVLNLCQAVESEADRLSSSSSGAENADSLITSVTH